MSEDPIGFNAGDTNHYRYVFNNPLGYSDPFGLKVPVGGIIDGGGTFIGSDGGAIGSIIGGTVGAPFGPGGVFVGGAIGGYVGDQIWNNGSIDPDSDNPNHPKFTPITPGPIPPSTPYLPISPKPSPNTCSP